MGSTRTQSQFCTASSISIYILAVGGLFIFPSFLFFSCLELNFKNLCCVMNLTHSSVLKVVVLILYFKNEIKIY